jgi:dihydrofolate reductase
MSRLVVVNNVTLDGVMQSPSSPDEDRRGGFEHGGWAPPYADEVMAEYMTRDAGQEGTMLFGRRTYEQFASYWPHQPDDVPFAAILNNRMKYVVSTTLEEPLPWANSTRLGAVEEVARLKEELSGHIVVLGSGQLSQALMRHGLVDEYVLSIHPLVLGSGRRLFPDGSPFAKLELVDSVTTTTGVLIGTFRPQR